MKSVNLISIASTLNPQGDSFYQSNSWGIAATYGITKKGFLNLMFTTTDRGTADYLSRMWPVLKLTLASNPLSNWIVLYDKAIPKSTTLMSSISVLGNKIK